MFLGAKPTDGFLEWRAYAKKTPDMPVGPLIKRGTPHLTEDEVYAYSSNKIIKYFVRPGCL